MKHVVQHPRFFQLLGFALIGLLLPCQFDASAYAVSAVQGYNTNQQLHSGTIVRQNPVDLSLVEPATYEDAPQAIGVVADSSAPASAIGQDVSGGGSALVASSGVFDVLVSDQAGPVRPGDYIEISGVPGVGMEADNDTLTVIGQALDSFDGSNPITTDQVRMADGSVRNVDIGVVRANIDVESNPLIYSQLNGVPTVLEKIARIFGATSISPRRIYLAFILFCISVLVCLVMALSTVVNKRRALIRNPLAVGVVGVASINIRLVAAIVLVAGFIGAVLVLRV